MPRMIVVILVVAEAGSILAADVKTGLDRIGQYERVFEGKRIGIIANQTSQDARGRFIVEVFNGLPHAKVAALFAPEHGLWGTEPAGEQVRSSTHPIYHIPVYSLYGRTQKPTPLMLAGVDVLAFDIQDIGARFYTYIWTMALAMEAAAEAGKPFVVLDRPNPITGTRVQGPCLDPAFASFMGLYPIPVVHGLTIGELARLFNEEGWMAGGIKADLTVIPMEGWRRDMWFDQTGLTFVRPSPNIPDLETAAVYPGLALLEGTNVSEGRGTASPFRQFGAPWIDSQQLADRLNGLSLPGLRFEPTTFTPTSSKYKDQPCHGVRLKVTDRNQLDPFYSGVRIVREVWLMVPDRFQWEAGHFDRLCGTDAVRKAVTEQRDLASLRRIWDEQVKAFIEIRKKYLMYSDALARRAKSAKSTCPSWLRSQPPYPTVSSHLRSKSSHEPILALELGPFLYPCPLSTPPFLPWQAGSSSESSGG